MTRTLKLYKCTAPNNELHKDKWLADEKIISPIIIKDECSISNPHIILSTFSGMVAYNYCYIEDFQRYYFIEDMITLPKGQVEIVCKCDVLYSFKNAISELIVHEERATNAQSLYLLDNEVPVQANSKIKKVYELPLKEKFKSMDTTDLMFIIRYFTKIQYNNISGTNQSGNPLSGASGNDDAVPVDQKNPLPISTEQSYICSKIKAKAEAYYKEFEDYCSKVINDYSCPVHPIFYTNNATYTSSSYKSSDKRLFVPKPEEVKFAVTRYDTFHSDEGEVTYNNNTRSTGLNVINHTWKENYNQGHSTNLIPTLLMSLDVNWTGWDCSQFAWRCCLFNSEFPVDVASSRVGDGTYTSTGDMLAFLMNNGCYCPTIKSTSDLVAGDLIFSGHLDGGSTHYNVGYKNGQWLCRDAGVDVSDLSHVFNVNHVRVYIGNGEYIDSTSKTFTRKDPSNVNSETTGNALNKGKMGTISYVNQYESREGTSKRIRVCRPCMLYGHQT